MLVLASAVRDAPSARAAQPSDGLLPLAVLAADEGTWAAAEVAVGDWVSARSRVQLRFVR